MLESPKNSSVHVYVHVHCIYDVFLLLSSLIDSSIRSLYPSDICTISFEARAS